MNNREPMNVQINDLIIKKLETISYDIKYYINVYASITPARNEQEGMLLMDEDDIEDILNIRKDVHRLIKKLKSKMDIKYYLLTHQTFDKLGAFYSDYPSEDEVIKVIEETYNKKVDNYEMLDYENLKFNFTDGTNVQLLLRDSKYV